MPNPALEKYYKNAGMSIIHCSRASAIPLVNGRGDLWMR